MLFMKTGLISLDFPVNAVFGLSAVVLGYILKTEPFLKGIFKMGLPRVVAGYMVFIVGF